MKSARRTLLSALAMVCLLVATTTACLKDDAGTGTYVSATADPRPYEQWLAARADIPADLALPGKFLTVAGHDAAKGPGRVLRYRLEVEDGIDIDARYLARAVHETLNDPRSWGGGRGTIALERVSSGDSSFTVTLASTGTVNSWCAKDDLDTGEQRVSCNVASTRRVMLNAWRWSAGSPTYGDDLANYRRMLVNHEVGHRLGHFHETCERSGALAPVMMQQTLTLVTGAATCVANPWPYP
ncbi:DUF3152 domain-containing protein [Streptomyces sp. SID3343]|uniref:DUF3152 domain-containing protein n=1 Tax=Streptomyces sp. SID3343 TaxID=2690260 RepID=UPI0031F946E0